MALRQIFVIAIIIFTITFAIRASNSMLATTIPLVAKYIFHFSPFLVGFLSSLLFIFSFISSTLINSRLSAKKREKMLKIFASIYALVFPLFYFANPILIWLDVSIAGFSMGIIFPNIVNYVSSIGDQKTRERMIALYTTALSTSLIVSPLLESLILAKFSLLTSFLIFSIFSFLVPIFSFKIKFNEDKKEKLLSSKEVLKSPSFIASVFNNLIYDIPFGMLVTFGGIYAISLFHASYSLAVMIFSFYYLTSFLSRFFFIIRTPRNIIAIIYANALITIFGLLAISLSPSLLVYVISLILLGIPHGLTYLSSLIIISRSFKDEKSRNVANSYFSSIGLSGSIPLIMGYVVEKIGLRCTFTLLSFISLVIFILFLIESKKVKELANL